MIQYWLVTRVFMVISGDIYTHYLKYLSYNCYFYSLSLHRLTILCHDSIFVSIGRFVLFAHEYFNGQCTDRVIAMASLF